MLDQLQRLDLVYLTEDLVNMSSLCTLKLEQLLRGVGVAVPPDADLAPNEDDAQCADGIGEGESGGEGTSMAWKTQEPPECAVTFTLRSAKPRALNDIRTMFYSFIGWNTSGFSCRSVCLVGLRAAVNLGLRRVPGSDSLIMRPVSLRAVFDLAKSLKQSDNGHKIPAHVDYERFRDVMWAAPAAHQVVKIFFVDDKEYRMINVGRIACKSIKHMSLSPDAGLAAEDDDEDIEWHEGMTDDDGDEEEEDLEGLEQEDVPIAGEPLDYPVRFAASTCKTQEEAVDKIFQGLCVFTRFGSSKTLGRPGLKAALELGVRRTSDGKNWLLSPVRLQAVFDRAKEMEYKGGMAFFKDDAFSTFRALLHDALSSRQLVSVFYKDGIEHVMVNIARVTGKYLKIVTLSKRDRQEKAEMDAAAAARATPAAAPHVPVSPQPPPPEYHPNPDIPTDSNGDFVLNASLANTVSLVRQAVADLQGHSDLGLLAVPSQSSSPEHFTTTVLVLALATPTGNAWVVNFGALRPADACEAWGLPSPLLQDAGCIKVTHDSRWLVPAIQRACGKSIMPIWDTQVAAGVAQFLAGVGGNATKTMQPQPTLELLFDVYGVSGAPEITASRPFSSSWHSFKLPNDNVAFLAAQAVHLLRLADKLNRELGSTGVSTVLRMSRAYSECLLPESKRGYAPDGPAAQRAADALPRGMPLEVFFKEIEGDKPGKCRALYRLGPENEGGLAGSVPDADPADSDSSGVRVWAPRRPVSAGDDDPTQNKDMQSMLELFPDHVSAAVVALCRGEPIPAPAAAAAPPASPLASDGREKPAPATPSRKRKYTVKRPAEKGFLWPIEIILDAGRPMAVRLSDGTEEELPETCQLSVDAALRALEDSKERLGASGPAASIFSSDNRAGVPGTLHRISAMRGRQGEVLGLTYRVGRHLEGVGELLRDVLSRLLTPAARVPPPGTAAAADPSAQSETSVSDGCSPSLLLLGPPGVGKTTLLRDVSRLLADEFRRRVVIVDTSAEIAGDGVVPHRCIGRARRMWVPHRDRQFEVMREAVQNHNPDAIVIDEISDPKEVAAARTIAQRGVALIGTAHGTSLETLLKNPELNPLVGGINTVILSDKEAKPTGPGKTLEKTKLERRGAPCFTMGIELLGTSHWRIHWDVAQSVDAMLAGQRPAATQLRWVAPDGRLMAQIEGDGGRSRPGEAGVLKAAHLASKALAGHQRAAAEWVADLSLLAARYADE